MKILFGPPGDSSRSAWFDTFIDDPVYASQTLWVTPTQRKRQWIGQRFREKHVKFPPRIHTFDDVVQLLYERLGGDAGVPAPDAVKAVLTVITQDAEIKTVLLKDLNTMPGPGLIAETARQIDELQRHGLTVDTMTSIPDAHEGYGRVFLTLYRAYQKYLIKHRKIDLGGMHLQVAEKLREDTAIALPWRRCVFDGFLELTPLQLDIIGKLSDRMEVTLVWPGNPAPQGILGWMVAGMKIAFPDAEWRPLRDEISVDAQHNDNPDSTIVSQLEAAAFHFGGYELECLPTDVESLNAPGRLRLIERGSLLDEITAIARDIRKRVDANGLRWSDIGVTFPDLQAVAPTIRRVFERYAIPVNLSQSLPLTGSPVFTSIERFLKLAGDWNRHDLLAVLGDSILTGITPDKTYVLVRRVAKWSSEYKVIRDKNRWISMLKEVMSAGAPTGVDANLAAQALEIVYRTTDALQRPVGRNKDNPAEAPGTRASVMEWLAWLRRTLTALQVNLNIEKLQRFALEKLPAGSQKFEYVRRAYNRLLEYFDAVEPFMSSIETVAETDTDITLTEFCDIFRRMLAGIDYQLTTQAGDRVQVLGLLGIHGLTFRHVYMGGLTDKAFPRPRSPSPFWYADLIDTILEAPPNQQRIAAFADMIRVMEAPLITLTLSRPTLAGDEELLPSLVWEYMTTLFQKPDIVADDREPLCLMERSIQTAQDLTADCPVSARAAVGKAVAGMKRSGIGQWCGDLEQASEQARHIILTYVGQERSFSPTSLEVYIGCPRAFFFERVLGLGEPDEPVETMSPLDRGSMIHDVLFRFYNERMDREFIRIRPDEIETSAARIGEIAVEEYERLGYSSEAARRDYMDIIGVSEIGDEGLAIRFARLEADGPQELQPRLLEWSFGRKSGEKPFVLLDDDGQDIVITGKIDRLDTVGDHDAVIWDYKSGKRPQKKEIDRFQRVQVGIYMLAASHILNLPINAGGYYKVKSRTAPDLVTVLRREGSEISVYLPEKGGSNTLKREWPEKDFLEYMEQLKSVIGQEVSAMRHGKFGIAESAEKCEWCVFPGLCRREREAING